MSEKKPTVLPCPFCGSKARLHRAINDPLLWWIIECSGLECAVKPCLEREGRENAITDWNKRP